MYGVQILLSAIFSFASCRIFDNDGVLGSESISCMIEAARKQLDTAAVVPDQWDLVAAVPDMVQETLYELGQVHTETTGWHPHPGASQVP